MIVGAMMDAEKLEEFILQFIPSPEIIPWPERGGIETISELCILNANETLVECILDGSPWIGGRKIGGYPLEI